MVKVHSIDEDTCTLVTSLYRNNYIIRLLKLCVYSKVVSKLNKIPTFILIGFFLSPFLTLAQDTDIETLVPAACYNFVNEFENDNGDTNCNDPDAPDDCIEDLIPEEGEGAFIPADELCGSENNQYYQMGPDEGLSVDNGSLVTQDEYTIELLFKVENLATDNETDRIFIMNFFNQNGAGLFVDSDGIIKYFDQNDNILAAGTTPIEGYPDDLPSEWINIAFSLSNDTLTVYFNGEEEFQYVDNDFVLRNNTSYFYPPNKMRGSGKENPEGEITLDYIRYFDQVLDATSIESLNLAAIAGNDIEIQASATAGCFGDEITLTAAGGDRSFYVWSTGDTTDTDILTYTIFKETDTIWVQGVAVSPCERQCFDIADTIVISGYPNPDLGIVGPTEVCEGDPVLFSSTADPAGGLTEYFWGTTGSTSSQSGEDTKDFAVTYDANGTVDVSLQIENEYGCVGDTTFQLVVNNVPTTGVSLPATACEDQILNVEYTGDATAGAVFTWDWDGGTVENINDPGRNFDVSWDSLGTKTIRFEIEEGNCLVVDSVTIEVLKSPTLEYTAPDSVCATNTVLIDYTGNADPATANINWNFQDGVNSGDNINAEVVWYDPGTKTITLTVEEGGCINDSTFTIEVLPVPTAEVNFPTEVCAGQPATFEYTGTANASADLVWTLDGGNVSAGGTDRLFDVTWDSLSLGIKTITLSISQDGCDTDTTVNINVKKSPTPDFDLPAGACMDEDIVVLYTGTANLSLDSTQLDFDWNWGIDGTAVKKSGGQEAYDVQWSSFGTKTVTLQVTENGCTSEVLSQTIEVAEKPVISFDPPIITSICNTETVVFNFDGTTGVNGVFDWDFGDATQVNVTDADTDFELEWDSAGTKTVILTITNDGCETTETFTIDVLEPASTQVTYPAYACVGEPSRFIYTGSGDTNDPGTTFTWTFEDASDSVNLGNQVYDVTWDTYDSADTIKNITLEITKDGCTVIRDFTISISPKPVPQINAPTEACLDESIAVTFDNDLAGASLTGFDFGTDGAETATADPEVWNVEWSSIGTKTISATYSINGCDSTVTQTIQVFPIPSSNMDTETEICDNETANFTYQGAGTPTITWNMPTGVTFTQVSGNDRDIEIEFPVTGTTEIYTIEATISNDNCQITFTEDVTVLPAPIAEIPALGTICTTEPVEFDISANYDSDNAYTWNLDGGTIDDSNGAGIWTMSWTDPGDKEVILRVQSPNGCVSRDTATVNTGYLPQLGDLDVPGNICENDSFVIEYLGNTAEVTDFDWTDEGGGNFNENSPGNWTVDFDSPGDKEVTLSMTGGAGCTVDTTFTINVNFYPEFGLSSNNTCTNIAVFVTYPDVLGADIDTTWNFGDGAIFEQVNDTTYSIEYETSGTKTITLTIDGDCGQEVQTTDVQVSPGPDYSINAAEQVCITDPDPYEIRLVEAVGSDVDIVDFELIPNDDGASGSISADGLRLLIDGWNYGGYKQVILEVEDASGSGCPVKFETIDYAVYNFIELNAFPDNGCIGEIINISFSGVVEDGATFNWDFDGAIVDTIATNEEFELTWDNSGPKMIGLEIVGECNTISDSLAINIGDPADTSLNFDSNVCEGEAANITYDMSLLTTASTVNGVEIIYHDLPSDTTNDDPDNGIFAPVWNTAGVKDFSLIVNNGGCIDTADYQITVYEIPVASFSRSDNRVCVGESVNLTFNGSMPAGTVVDWEFMLDDANDSIATTSDRNYTVSWRTPGIKTIQLILDNGGCIDSVSRNVEVLPFPDFEIVMPADVCRNAPVTVSLQNNGTGTISDFEFDWDFGDATVTDLGNEEYELVFATVSTQTVTVDIIGDAGCNNSLSQNIIINPAPDLVYDTSPSTLKVCVGEEFTFEYTGVAGTNYVAPIDITVTNFDGGTEVFSSPTESTITWDSAGFKEIRVEVLDNNNCPSVVRLEVEVLPLPTMTYEAPTDYCLGEEFIVRYTGSADPFTSTFNWNFDPADLDYATKIAGQQAYRVRYDSVGTIGPRTIDIAVTNTNGCSNDTSFVVNIVQGPTDFSVDPGPICAFDQIAFYQGTETIVNIDPGQNGIVDSTNQNLLTWSTPGIKTVSLTLTNGNCEITREFEIEVLPTPLGEITVDVGCVGQSTLVSYGGADAAGIFANYDWGTSFDAATSVSKLSGQEAYEVVWDTSGTIDSIYVQITVENGCVNTIFLPGGITINPSPTVAFALPATICEFVERTLFISNPDSTYQYSWNVGANGVVLSSNADSTQVRVVWEDIGDKNVTVTAANLEGCTTTRTRTIRVLNSPDPSFDAPIFCLDEGTGQATGTIVYTGDNDLVNDTFDWDFDIDATAGESATQIPGTENYDVVYTTPGRKNVSLTVTNSNCGSQTFTDIISVNNLAEFNISSANDEECLGAVTQIVFTGVAEDGAIFNWDFSTVTGDVVNEIVADSLYEITYNSTGTKVITLDITGDICNDASFQDSFVIGEAPTSDFTLGATENCLGDLTTITFTGTASDGADLVWDWVDGIPTQLNDSTFEVSWPSPGTKDISLLVEDGGCISETTFQTINVYENSAATLSIDTELCIDDIGIASIDTTFFEPGATWSWDFQGVDVLNSDPDSTELTFSYNSSGEKTVRFMIDGDICNDFDTTMFINIGERIPFDISADTEICSNDSARIVFNLPMVNGRELEWDFDSPSRVTPISTTREDYFVTWDSVGIKNITVTINNKGCIRDSTFQVEVKQLPNAEFQTDDYMCQDDVLRLVPDWEVSPFSIISWDYDYNGQIGSQNEADFELLLDEAGTIVVTLGVLENGCQDFYTDTIEIREKPLASINAPDFICLEGTANIEFADSLRSGVQYDWFFDGATTETSLGNETYELGWDESGVKTLYVVTTLDGCPSDTAFHNLNVFSLDNLTSTPDTICQHQTTFVEFEDEGLGIPDDGFSWDFGDAQIISGDANSFGPIELFWDSPGEKVVTLVIDGFVCDLSSLSKSITVEPSSFPEINISVPDLVCKNTDVSVAFELENEGDNPQIEWFINGVSIGDEFDSTFLSNQDIIRAKLISNAECVIENEVMSNEVIANILDYQYQGNTYANPNPVCIGDSVVVSLDPGNYNILDWEISTDLDNWASLGVSNAELVDFPEEDTYYRARIIDVQGLCPQVTPPATASVVPYVPIDAGNDITIREGDTRILEATRGQSFVWRNDVSIQSDVRNARIQVSPVKTTTFIVDGLTLNGCPDVDSVTVVVRPPVDPPNVFSPNGDSFNDVWQVDQIDEYPEAVVKIYDRWGKELFQSIGYDDPWDGRFNGEVLAPGVYYYVIDLKDGYDAVTGTITILY